MRGGPTTSEPELCSCSALRQAARHVTRLYDAALAPVELGLNQYAILSRRGRFGPMRRMDLAAKLVMDRSTLGHLLRPLEKRGFVRLQVGERDRRSRVLTLTDEGDMLLSRARVLWEAAEARFSDAYGAGQARDLRAVLKHVEAITFEEHAP